MIQILPQSDGSFELRTKETPIVLDHTVTIGPMTLPGDGEYEVGGIMVDISGGITRLETADLTLGHLAPRTTKLTDHELEQLGPIDVLFFSLAGTDHTLPVKEAVALIGQVEAPLMIPLVADSGLLEDFCKSVGSCERVKGSQKLTKNSLPTDGARVFVIEPAK